MSGFSRRTFLTITSRLAALLRFSLDAAERGLVPLAHELKIVTDYLEIEHTRLGERLTWSVDVPADATAREARERAGTLDMAPGGADA